MTSTERRLTGAFNVYPVLIALMAAIGTAPVSAAADTTVPIERKVAKTDQPTVVLVHGAFAESSSWNGVTSRLLAKGYHVIAAANLLRSVAGDAAYVGNIIDSVNGPVVLVGHSYGGNVITVAAQGRDKVKALVYVAAFAADIGESAATLSAKFPGSTLAPALGPPVVLADGSKDLYIMQDKYHAQFCADLPAEEARLMATTQRPITEKALNDPVAAVAWRAIPSWFLYGSLDKNIPAAVHAFMAKRAGARQVIEVKGASHVVGMSHPDALVKLIDAATAATVAQKK